MSDRGPQFSSQEFFSFTEEYQFKHMTSSHHYPQANGLAKHAVQTIKGLLQTSMDPHLALLAHRSTPRPWCGLSPAQLLMGRTIHSTTSQVQCLLFCVTLLFIELSDHQDQCYQLKWISFHDTLLSLLLLTRMLCIIHSVMIIVFNPYIN